MAIPILKTWKGYFLVDRHEGLGSSYERIILNSIFGELANRYDIRSVLEVPIFGFTGLSGINSMWFAKNNIELHLIDNHKERIKLIRQIWNEVSLKANIIYQQAFEDLPFNDKSIDFAWNYSAMWFLDDMIKFLSELTRVVSKAIMICVPNRCGFGYLSQKYISGSDLRKYLREDFIIPRNIRMAMEKMGWRLIQKKYIDCPPWPDIGMKKEEFLNFFGLRRKIKDRVENQHQPLTILDYYSGRDPRFPDKMLSHYWFERKAPIFIKAFWAHHCYLLFEPADKNGLDYNKSVP